MRVKALMAATLLGVVLQSCNIINPAETVPTYISLDSFKVSTDSFVKTGSTSNKITSAWVYVNNNIVGVFDVPGKIPLMLTTQSTIAIAPAITYSGVKDFQAIYPFYTFDTFSLSPSPGKVIPHTGHIKYTSAAVFAWKEDFETGNKFQNVNNAVVTDTTLNRVSERIKVFEGGASGGIFLNTTRSTSQVICTDDIKIAKGEPYIELNYKCNTSFEVGLQTINGGNIEYEYLAGVKANENWSKIYIGIASFVGRYNAGSIFHVMIKTSLPSGQETAYVLLDNIKVLSN